MKGVHPSLIVGRRCPLAHYVVTIFVEAQMHSDRIVGRTAYAVVALDALPGIYDFLQVHRKEKSPTQPPLGGGIDIQR